MALCLHGLGEDRCMALWSHFWLPMLKKGFHVVALDLPGDVAFGWGKGRKVCEKNMEVGNVTRFNWCCFFGCMITESTLTFHVWLDFF